MIKPLKYLNAISILEEVHTDGHSPLKVIAEDYKEYYIKSTQGKKPSLYIINEFLCSYLLNIWKIPSPEIAAIKVNPDILPGNLSKIHKKHYYNEITFGSKSIPGSFEMNMFINTIRKFEYKKLVNPDNLIRLGLFDIWVENTDRKPTNNNVLIISQNKLLEICAIDNAFTFDCQDYMKLDSQFISNTYNDNILFTEFAQSIAHNLLKNKDWVSSIREYFYICIGICQHFFNEIVNNIPLELEFTITLQQAIEKFLFNESRNKQVFEEFLTRLPK